MKRMWFIFLALLILPVQSHAMKEKDELIQMASLIKALDLQIATWEVTIKETIYTKNIEDIIQDFKNSHLVTVHEDENRIKYKVLFQQPQQHGLEQELQVVVSKHDEFRAELSAVIKGSTWDETILKEYKAMLELLLDSYFSHSASMFTCLETHNDDIIKEANFFNKIRQSFKIKHESTQIDTSQKNISKKIIYGYTDLWKQKIVMEDQPMNVQFVIKNMDNENSHLIVGTPILINEY